MANKRAPCCGKVYHTKCVGWGPSALASADEGEEWICPRHYCNTCGKWAVVYCRTCEASYCREHGAGAVASLPPWAGPVQDEGHDGAASEFTCERCVSLFAQAQLRDVLTAAESAWVRLQEGGDPAVGCD